MDDSRNVAALHLLEEQGFKIGEYTTITDGRMRIWIRSKKHSALVETGQELWNLATGCITLADIKARRNWTFVGILPMQRIAAYLNF